MEFETFSDLLLEIYKTPTEPVYWQAILERLSGYVKNGKAILTTRDNVTGDINIYTSFGSKIHNIDEDSLNKYTDEAVRYDIWTQYEWKCVVGELCIFSEHLPIAELKKSKYYKEWLEPQGITDGIAIQLHNREKFRIVLNVIYDHESENISKLHGDLKLLIPHLCQAVNLWMATLDKSDACYGIVDPSFLEQRYGLTPTEAKVANLSARLPTSQDIADHLGVSVDTIKTHFRNISKKMGVAGKKEVSLIANGFIGFSEKRCDK